MESLLLFRAGKLKLIIRANANGIYEPGECKQNKTNNSEPFAVALLTVPYLSQFTELRFENNKVWIGKQRFKVSKCFLFRSTEQDKNFSELFSRFRSWGESLRQLRLIELSIARLYCFYQLFMLPNAVIKPSCLALIKENQNIDSDFSVCIGKVALTSV